MKTLKKMIDSILLLLKNYDLTYILAFQMLASLVTFVFLFITLSKFFLIKIEYINILINSFSDSVRPFISNIVSQLSDKTPSSFTSFDILNAVLSIAILLFFSSSIFRSIRYVLSIIFKIDYKIGNSGIIVYLESFLIVILLVAYFLFLILLAHIDAPFLFSTLAKYISFSMHFLILLLVEILIYYLYYKAIKIKFNDVGFSFYALYGSLFSLLIDISGSLLLKKFLIFITKTPAFAIYGNIYILICWFILISFSFVLCAELTYGLREQNLTPKRFLKELLR